MMTDNAATTNENSTESASISNGSSYNTPSTTHRGAPSSKELLAEAAIGRPRLPIHNLVALARGVNASNALGRIRERRKDSSISLTLTDGSKVDQLVYQSRVMMSDQPYHDLKPSAAAAAVISTLSLMAAQDKTKRKSTTMNVNVTSKASICVTSGSSSTAVPTPKPFTTLSSMSDLAHPPEVGPVPVLNMEARILCAKSLYKLSCHDGNEMEIIQGDSITEVVDFSDVDNEKFQEVCAAIIANLTTRMECLDAFVSHQGITALLELCWAPSIEAKLHCAIAMCRLSGQKSHATALGKAKAYIELSAMLNIAHEELQRTCVSCAMNLLFFGKLFNERIFSGDPHALTGRLGIMNVVSELAKKTFTMRFAADVLFNLSLYRVSAIAAIRSGAPEILHMIATHVCKVGLIPSAPSRLLTRIDPRTNRSNQIMMFRLIADAMANYSSYHEYVSSLSSYFIKTLALLLYALRDKTMESFGAGAAQSVDDTISAVGGSCARVFANFSAVEELRKAAFHDETVHLVCKLLLLSPQCFANPRAFLKDVIRTIANLSFHDTCTKSFMRSPAPLQLLHATVTCAVIASEELQQPEEDDENQQLLLLSDDEVVEDALVAIVNVAASGRYVTELLACLDGQQLAKAADQQPKVGLKHIYCTFLCNLVFDARLRQLVAGDWVVNVLISGLMSRECESDDDRERFLAALFQVANTIQEPKNLQLLVQVMVSCFKGPKSSVNQGRRRSRTCSSSTSLIKEEPDATSMNSCFEYFGAAILCSLTSSVANPQQVKFLLESSNGEMENMLLELISRPNASDATRACCAATLYHICASGNAKVGILQALVDLCNVTENLHMLLSCSASFAKVSFTSKGMDLLLRVQSIATAITKLGTTSDVECQQYAAIAACNVSTRTCIWSLEGLRDFIVVALLRANSSRAKQIHARTLYNLLSHSKTRARFIEEGVLYALMKLAHVQSAVDADLAQLDDLLGLGFQVLYNLSCEEQYHTTMLKKGVVQYLLTSIHGKRISSAKAGYPGNGQEEDDAKDDTKDDAKSHRESRSNPKPTAKTVAKAEAVSFRLGLMNRRYGAGILAQLSAFEANHKELMDAQFLHVLLKYCDHDIETRACVVIALRNLSCRQPWVELVSERKILALLLALSASSSKLVQRLAMDTLVNCSLVTDAVQLFDELQVIQVLLHLLQDATPEIDTSLAALKMLHNLAFDDTLATQLMQQRAIERIRRLLRSMAEKAQPSVYLESCLVASRMANLLAGKPKCIPLLMAQDIVGFCGEMFERHTDDVQIGYESVCTLMEISTFQEVQLQFTESLAISIIVRICERHGGKCTSPQALAIRECGAIALRNLTICVTNQSAEFYEPCKDEEDEVPLALYASTEIKPRRVSSLESTSDITWQNLLFGVKHLQHEIQTLTALKNANESSLDTTPTTDTSRSRASAYEACKDSEDSFSTESACEEVMDHILHESAAAITNLSSISRIRADMERSDILSTLLQLCSVGIDICASTLHRFTLHQPRLQDHFRSPQDQNKNHDLVPNLLSILNQTDDALQCVRYECEKVSKAHNRLAPIRPLAGATKCYRPTFRDPKWSLHILETSLSSRHMVPEFETKPPKLIGGPKSSSCNVALAQRDDPTITVNATVAGDTPLGAKTLSAAFDQQNSHSALQGFLLPVDSHKRQVMNIAKLDARSTISSHQEDSEQRNTADTSLHIKKYERHMRTARRNNRQNPKAWPLASIM